jgi:hypothetical protein
MRRSSRSLRRSKAEHQIFLDGPPQGLSYAATVLASPPIIAEPRSTSLWLLEQIRVHTLAVTARSLE